MFHYTASYGHFTLVRKHCFATLARHPALLRTNTERGHHDQLEYYPKDSTMTLPKYGLRYGRCTNKGIKKFVRVHGLRGLPPNRSACIQALRAQDQESSFRFLDLPAELRNLVYHYVLTPSSQFAQPNCFRQNLLSAGPSHLQANPCRGFGHFVSDVMHPTLPKSGLFRKPVQGADLL